ncbi:hypothetical protein [Altericista sp. CCNU0014]|uniref:hypothetical protein n=1 Tax=Altericista sp. CCNU0014 TaxID=3082949 RepID=UPI00384D811E
MTQLKQGMLLSHAIALTLILLVVVAWKTPSPQDAPSMRLEGRTSVLFPSSSAIGSVSSWQ